MSGSNRGIMLIGSKDKLMHSMLVEHKDDLLQAYDKVMQHMHETFFKLFYESTANKLSKNNAVIEALDFVDWLDMHSFLTNCNVWNALNVDKHLVSSPSLCEIDSFSKFPLECLQRCVKGTVLLLESDDLTHCVSSTSGPSDTTAKLLDNCEEHLSVRTPRTIVTARLIAVGTVAFHRSYQMLTVKHPSVGTWVQRRFAALVTLLACRGSLITADGHLMASRRG